MKLLPLFCPPSLSPPPLPPLPLSLLFSELGVQMSALPRVFARAESDVLHLVFTLSLRRRPVRFPLYLPLFSLPDDPSIRCPAFLFSSSTPFHSPAAFSSFTSLSAISHTHFYPPAPFSFMDHYLELQDDIFTLVCNECVGGLFLFF